MVRLIGEGSLEVVARLSRSRRGKESLSPSGALWLGALGPAGGDGEEAVVRRAGRRSLDLCVHGGIVPAQRLLDALRGRGVTTVSAAEGALAGWRSEGCHTLRWESRQALVHARGSRGLSFLAAPGQRGLEAVVRHLVTASVRDSRGGAGREEIEAKARLLETAWARARRLLLPTSVTLVGPVNAGKSTLLNRLCGRDRMVVSPEPGTTRESIEVELELGGCSFRVKDTPGFEPERPPSVNDAVPDGVGVTLLLLDGDREPTPAETRLARECKTRRDAVVVVGKADRGAPTEVMKGIEGGSNPLRVSSVAGIGLVELIDELLRASGAPGGEDLTGPVVFTERQRRILGEARRALQGGGVGAAVRSWRQMLSGVPDPEDAVLGGWSGG